MIRRELVCLGMGLTGFVVACDPPAKVPSPPEPSAAWRQKPAQLAGSASAASTAAPSGSSVLAQPLASAPIYPPCPPEVPEPADALAWVSECNILIRKKIVFDLDKSTIRPESFPVIDAVGDILLQNPDLRVEIEGHLGEPRQHAYSRRLSQDRAKSIYRYLVAKKGVPAAQLSYNGYENEKPIADWRTDEGRAKNRRIEFVILGWRPAGPPR